MPNRAERRAAKKQGIALPATRPEKVPHRVARGVTPMRVTWASNSPFAPTGYGVQTAQVVERLQADGHEVAVACNFGLQGSETEWNGIKLYPTGVTPYSDDILSAHAQHWASGSDLPSVVITLFDVWALKNPSIARIPRIAAWVPIDHKPAPPEVTEWLRRDNVLPIAMSHFGSEMMEVDKIEHLYAPHAFDGRVFKPTPSFKDAAGNTIRGREIMGVEDEFAFVVMMNSANKGRTPPRKSWGENLLAFGVFAQDKPDAILYLHTDESAALGGVDLRLLVKACGIREEQVRFVNQYLYRMNMPQTALASLYTDADVLLATSAGEGFGVPVIEAQACGTPVIVSNWTAQPELVGDGWIVDGQPLWDAFQNSWFFTPNVGNIVRALEEAYQRPRGIVSEDATRFAAAYEADRVYAEYWRPIMETLARWEP
ncbi:MAG TPA: glycosyltransferase family 4 protein [Acidimicrobiia bacterium]